MCERLEGVPHHLDQRNKASVLRGHPPWPERKGAGQHGTAVVCCAVTPSMSWVQDRTFTGCRRLPSLGNWEQPEGASWSVGSLVLYLVFPRAPSPQKHLLTIRGGSGFQGGGAIQRPALLTLMPLVQGACRSWGDS